MKPRCTPVIFVAALIGFGPIVAVVAQSTQPMMKAAVVHEYGGPEVFKYEDVPRPEPTDDEVLVRVMAATTGNLITLTSNGREQGSSVGGNC